MSEPDFVYDKGAVRREYTEPELQLDFLASVNTNHVAGLPDGDFDLWVPYSYTTNGLSVAAWPFLSGAECADAIRSGPMCRDGFRPIRMRDLPRHFAEQEDSLKAQMRAKLLLRRLAETKMARAPDA